MGKEIDPPALSGYQQAILLLLGCATGGRYLVRCVDRHYIDAVSDLFPTSPYLQQRSEAGKRDYWVLKSAMVRYDISLSDIRDDVGFCRGIIELQGTLDLWQHRIFNGGYARTPRLRIYGASELLEFVSSVIPAAPKKSSTFPPPPATPAHCIFKIPPKFWISFLSCAASLATRASGNTGTAFYRHPVSVEFILVGFASEPTGAGSPAEP